MSVDYYKKYMKYKTKYMKLKGGRNIDYKGGKLDLNLFDCTITVDISDAEYNKVLNSEKELISRKYTDIKKEISDRFKKPLDILSKYVRNSAREYKLIPSELKTMAEREFNSNSVMLEAKSSLTKEINQELSKVRSEYNINKIIDFYNKLQGDNTGREIGASEVGKLLEMISNNLRVYVSPDTETKVNGVMLSPHFRYEMIIKNNGKKYVIEYVKIGNVNKPLLRFAYKQFTLGKNRILLVNQQEYEVNRNPGNINTLSDGYFDVMKDKFVKDEVDYLYKQRI